MEEKLLKLEKLNALGVVTAGVAHEFNNILSIISGNVQMLEIGYVDKVVLKDKVRIIRKVINDGSEIVRRMNVFTSVEKDFSRYLSFDIRDIIKQTIWSVFHYQETGRMRTGFECCVWYNRKTWR